MLLPSQFFFFFFFFLCWGTKNSQIVPNQENIEGCTCTLYDLLAWADLGLLFFFWGGGGAKKTQRGCLKPLTPSTYAPAFKNNVLCYLLNNNSFKVSSFSLCFQFIHTGRPISNYTCYNVLLVLFCIQHTIIHNFFLFMVQIHRRRPIRIQCE